MFSFFHHGHFPGTLSPFTDSFIHLYKKYSGYSSWVLMTQNTKLQLLQSSDSSLNLLARVSSTKWVFSLTGSSLHCCLCTWSELAIPKPSTTAYHSHWFCIFKSNGKTLCLVHDLQPLNTITIYDSSAPPFIKHFAESFARFTVYCMLDFHYRFNQHPLDLGSHNFTTFNSPMGSMHLITVPTRYTNAVQIY